MPVQIRIDDQDSRPSWSLHDISVILKTHIAPSVSATATEHIPSGSHAVYEVRDSSGTRYILKLGARMWPQKIETEVATLMHIRDHTQIPVPTVRGYRVGDWRTDYLLMDFVEGEKLDMIWGDLSQEDKIYYTKQIAWIYAQLDQTFFTSIGSLRLGGVVGPLDTLETITASDGRIVGVSLGPYANLQAFWRGQFDHFINQLETDPLLIDNADLCQDLRKWAEKWCQQAQAFDHDAYRLFGLECIKMQDIIVRDRRIAAILDFENFQTNVPEFMKLHSPWELGEEMETVFNEECEELGVSAWNTENSRCYDFCLRSTLLTQSIVPGDYNSYLRKNDLEGLSLKLLFKRAELLSVMKELDG